MTRAGSAKRWGRSAVPRTVLLVIVNLGVLVLLLAVVEGCASMLLFARDSLRTAPLAERLHTRYDPELGWVNLPDVRLPNMYGAGIDLSTNSRGFRGRREVAATVAPDVLRVICSGDSFTLGYGVSDNDTWCHLLERAGGLESINLGQGGYGLDQAWLWYRRDAAGIEHHMHILALITDDIRRMRHDSFLGYGKPVLRLAGDSIAVGNVPVPRQGFGVRSWFVRMAEPIRSLRTTQFAARVASRWTGGAARRNTPVHSEDEVREVVDRLLRVLSAEHERAARRMIVLHLPTEYELRGDGPVKWQMFFAERAASLGFDYIDLFPYFRSLPDSIRSRMFLQPGEVQFPNAAGHFSAAGNDVVARVLLEVLNGT